MKELFIIWVVFQLLVIGATSIKVNNQVATEDFNCDAVEVPVSIGYMVPMYAFVPTPHYVTEYCNERSN